MAGKNDYQKIYYHKVGTAAIRDKMIYETTITRNAVRESGVHGRPRLRFSVFPDSSAENGETRSCFR